MDNDKEKQLEKAIEPGYGTLHTIFQSSMVLTQLRYTRPEIICQTTADQLLAHHDEKLFMPGEENGIAENCSIIPDYWSLVSRKLITQDIINS